MTPAAPQGLPIFAEAACLPAAARTLLCALALAWRNLVLRWYEGHVFPTTKGLLLAMNAGQARHIKRRRSNATLYVHSILQQVFLTGALTAHTCVSQCLFLTTNIPASDYVKCSICSDFIRRVCLCYWHVPLQLLKFTAVQAITHVSVDTPAFVSSHPFTTCLLPTAAPPWPCWVLDLDYHLHALPLTAA